MAKAPTATITPTTKQQVAAGSGTIPASHQSAEQAESETELNPLHPEVGMDVSPNSPNDRWTSFEAALRRRREGVLQSSIESAKRADPALPAEGEHLERRKAS